jgi:hypothetical protein
MLAATLAPPSPGCGQRVRVRGGAADFSHSKAMAQSPIHHWNKSKA